MLLQETKIFNGKQEIQELGPQSTIVIKEGSFQIEIDPDGKVRLLADNMQALRKLRSAVEISLRASTRWNYELSLSLGRITDKQTGQQLGPQISISNPAIYTTQVNGRLLENITSYLAASNEMALYFLQLASDLIQTHVELAVLTALTALELSISEAVQSDDLQTSGRIAVLTFTKALAPDDISRLKKLWTIRNKLAHGLWSGDELGLAISQLLGGGPREWLTESGHLNVETSKKILWQITYAIQILSGKASSGATSPPLAPEKAEEMTGVIVF